MIDRRTFCLTPAALAIAGAAPLPVGEAAPRLRARTARELPQPLPSPYDAAAHARAQVAMARTQARKTGRQLIIDLGANWCPDCRVIAGIFELAEMKPWIARHFVIVQVDVGRFDTNLDIAKENGLKRLRAIPAMLVIDPKSGKLRNPGEELAISDAATMAPQSVADWMARWTV